MAAPSFGKTIIQQAKGKHTATCFILHGLGGSGEGLSDIGPALQLPHVKFLYPTAPIREVTLNAGARGTAWFDMRHPDIMNVRDEVAISASVDYVKGLIADEVAAGVPPDRIVLGGFSQGGHISLRTAAALEQPLASIAALSTWCEAPPKPVAPQLQQMPIFIAHGTSDMLLPTHLAKMTTENMRTAGFKNVELHTYTGMGHTTCPEELRDLRSFLLRAIPDKLPTSEEVESMSVKDLRTFLSSHGIGSSTFLEKSEFVTAAKDVLSRKQNGV